MAGRLKQCFTSYLMLLYLYCVLQQLWKLPMPLAREFWAMLNYHYIYLHMSAVVSQSGTPAALQNRYSYIFWALTLHIILFYSH